jgi:preprotein translocase subunit SecA
MADVDVSVEVAAAPEPEPASASEDDAMAKKRAEIMAKVAAAKAAQEKAKEEEKLDASKFGTHKSITCDGCGTVPIVGYRWRCRSCKNHDLCDICYESFKGGKLPQSVDQQRCNPVSPRVEDHEFFAYAEQGSFSGMKGASGAPKVKTKKTKPNEPCPCGSGKKYKKCCMNKKD